MPYQMKIRLLLLLVICSPVLMFAQTGVSTIQTAELIQMVDSSKKPIIVSFWATWCSPCLNEIPWLEKEISGKAQDSIVLILISLDTRKTVRDIELFVARKGFHSKVYIWQNPSIPEFAKAMNIRWTDGIPATYLRSNEKNRRIFFNRQLTELQIKRELNNLLKD